MMEANDSDKILLGAEDPLTRGWFPRISCLSVGRNKFYAESMFNV